jgi:hypothetical protein
MAQTTGQIPQACGKVEVSDDGNNWDDISGSAQSVVPAEQPRNVGEGYTLTGDTAVMAAGKLQPIDVVIQIIYTENDTEAYELARAIHETACGAAYYVRWSPGGGDVGDDRITSGSGLISSFQYPSMDATAGGPIITSYTVRVPSVATAAIAS